MKGLSTVTKCGGGGPDFRTIPRHIFVRKATQPVMGMTICAWCQGMIEKAAAARQPAPTSHGICKSCLDRQLEQAQATPRARAA